jgi:hypothetical protein
VVRGQPRLTFVATCGGRGAPHTGATRLPAIAVVVAGRGCGPLKALLVPLFATLPAVVGGDVGRCSLAAARGHLPASLSWTRHDHLVVNGVLGSDVVWRLECVSKEVAMLTLVWALCVVLGLHAHAPWRAWRWACDTMRQPYCGMRNP